MGLIECARKSPEDDWAPESATSREVDENGGPGGVVYSGGFTQKSDGYGDRESGGVLEGPDIEASAITNLGADFSQ